MEQLIRSAGPPCMWITPGHPAAPRI